MPLIKWDTISNFFMDKAKSADTQAYNKRVDYLNNSKKLEKYLDIPIVGGWVYVYKRFNQGLFLNKTEKKEYQLQDEQVDLLAKNRAVHSSMKKIFDEIVENEQVKTIEIPIEYIGIFEDEMGIYNLKYTSSREGDVYKIVVYGRSEY